MSNTIKIKQIDQTQLAAFVNDILDGTGAVYTANRALVTDGAGDVTTSSVTATELGYLSGVTSAIQTQFNNLGSTYLALAGGTMTGALTLDAASLLKFGGATASFPALKRSSTELQVRLADDSGYAPFRSGPIVINDTADGSGNYQGLKWNVGPFDPYFRISILGGGSVFRMGVYADTDLNFVANSSVGLVVQGSQGGIVIGSNNDVRIARIAADTLGLQRGTNAQTLQVYGTYTDASNFVRASLAATSTTVTLAAETAGTGADNIDLILSPAGTGIIKIGSPLAAVTTAASVVTTGDFVLSGGNGTNYLAWAYAGQSPRPIISVSGSYSGTTMLSSPGTDGAILFGAQATEMFRIGNDGANVFAQRNGTNAQTFRVYGTYTDGSNFVRASLAATSTSVTLAAQTAGTGTDTPSLVLSVPASSDISLGGGSDGVRLLFGNSNGMAIYGTPAQGLVTIESLTDPRFCSLIGPNIIYIRPQSATGPWGASFQRNRLIFGDYTGTFHTGIECSTSGLVEINDGTTQTNYRDLKLRTLTATNSGSNAKLVDFTAQDWAIRDGTGGNGGIYISNSSFSSMVAFQSGGIGISYGTALWWAAFPNSQIANTAIARSSNGVVQINTGSNNSFGDLQLRTLQGFYSYTDGSNYQGYKLTSGATSVTLSAETAGTGADNVDVNITPAGTGQTVVTNLYAHRDFSTAYSNGKMLQVTGDEGRTATFGTVSGQPAIAFGSDLTTNFAANGYIYGHSGCLQFVGGGNNIRFWNSIEIGYPATFYVATGGGVITRNYLAICDSAAAATDGADVVLRRDAANTLALRNGSNGQKLRVYGDYTGASQYCALELSCTQTGGDYFSHYIGPVNAGGGDYWNDNRGEIGGWAFLTISAMANASGDAGALFFKAGGYYFANALEGGQNAYFDGRGSTSPGTYGHKNYFSNTNTASHTLGLWQPNGHTKSALTVYTNSVLKADITSAGAFRSYGAWTDDSNYVRASLSAAASSVTLAAETAGTGADDVSISLNPAGTGVVGIGGLTSSYPALKRSSTELQVRLADDSGYATTAAGCFTSHGSQIDPQANGYWMLRHRNSDGGAYWGFSQKNGGSNDIGVFIAGTLTSAIGYKFEAHNTNGGLGWSSSPGAAGPNLVIVRDTTDVVAIYGTTNAALRLYGAYTDASNYVRASLAATSTSVTLAAETAGTGADNIDTNLRAAGTGAVTVGNGSNQFSFYIHDGNSNCIAIREGGGWSYIGTVIDRNLVLMRDSVRAATLTANGFMLGNASDAGISRNADGVVEVNNGTPGTYRDMRLRTITVDAADGNGLQFNGGGSVEAYSNYLTLTSPYTGFAFYSPQVGANVLTTDNTTLNIALHTQIASNKAIYFTSGGEISAASNVLNIKAYTSFVLSTTGGSTRRVAEISNTGELYGFYSYTDASNYQGYKLTSGASSVTLSAETAGTGADDIDLILSPAGAGKVGIGTASPTQLLSVGSVFKVSSTGVVTIKTGGSGLGGNQGLVAADGVGGIALENGTLRIEPMGAASRTTIGNGSIYLGDGAVESLKYDDSTDQFWLSQPLSFAEGNAPNGVYDMIRWGDGAGTSSSNPTYVAVSALKTAANEYGLTFDVSTAATKSERMRLSPTGFLGIGTTSPTHLLSLGGNSARTIWMERHTTSDTAGNNLTVQAGSATSGATNKAGGYLDLLGGISTGTGESGVRIKGYVAGSSGTSDTSASTMIEVLGNKVGFFGVTPVVRQTTGIAAATFVANTSAIADDTATWGGYTAGQIVTALKNVGILT